MLTVIGMLVISPGLAAVMLIAVPPLVLCIRWYLRRSAAAYLGYAVAAAGITEELSASLSGAATVEAFGLGDRRVRVGDESVAMTFNAELATLRLRTIFLPATELGYRLPMIAALLLGGVFYTRNWASLGAVTAVVDGLVRTVESGHLPQRVLAFEETQFDAVVARLGCHVEHLRKRPVRNGES